MAKTNAYLVSFCPAKRFEGGFSLELSLLTRGQQHEVEASSLPDLEAKVRSLAEAFGQTCSPYVRLADRTARKPAGFDKWADTMRVLN